MKKSKIFAVVLSIVMAFAVFAVVGCDEKEPEPTPATEYSVIFKDGDTEVKTVKVLAGSVLTAEDVPAGPTKEGYTFVGWFNGETEIKAGVAINADTTALAKYNAQETTFSVTFKVGETTVKTATVKEGEKLAAADVPEDPDELGYAFSGWLIDGDKTKPFDPDEDAVTANTVLIANMVKTSAIAKFVNGTTEVKAAAVNAGGKLQSTDVPGAAIGNEGEVFLGWYAGAVKAESGLTLDDDTTFYATFVKESDYTGAWYNDEECLTAIFGADNKVSVMGKNYSNLTYENGTKKCSTGSGYSTENFTFTVIGNIMTVNYGAYDSYEDWEDVTYTFTKGEEVAYAGEYRATKTDAMTVLNGGIVSGTSYARIVEDDGVYKLVTSAAQEGKTLTFDENGFVLDGKIYVKDVTEFAQYKSGSKYLYIHTVGAKTIYVYNNEETNEYVDVTGTIELNGGVSVSADSGNKYIKITKLATSDAEGTFQIAGAERGSYSIKDQSSYRIILDGFGTASKSYTGASGTTTEYDYYMIGEDTLVLVVNLENASFEGYTLTNMGDLFNGEATVKGQHSIKGKYQSQKQYYSGHYVYIDGYGGVIDTYGSYTYYGEYDLDGDANTLTITTDSNNLSSGTYTLVQSENVILNADDKTCYLKDGETLESHINDFVGANNGWWKNDADEEDYVVIDIEKGTIKFGEESNSYNVNWNGTKLGFRTYVSGTGWIDCIFTVVDGKLNVKIGDEEPISYTSAPKPVVEKDEFEGFWIGNGNKFYFDGFGNVYFANSTTASSFAKYAYSKSGEEISFSANGQTMTVTIKTNGNLNVHWDDGEADGNYEASASASDDYAGTWTMNEWTLVFSGDGHAYVSDGGSVNTVVKYTVSSGKATFEANSDTWNCTLSGNSLDVITSDSDGFTGSVSGTFTKETAGGGQDEELDAFAGTWKFGDWTLTFDGKGKVNVNNGYSQAEVNYTIANGKASFSALYISFTAELKNDKLSVDTDDDEGLGGPHDFIKQ